MIDEIKAAMAELESAGLIERTGEMRWDEHVATRHRRRHTRTPIAA